MPEETWEATRRLGRIFRSEPLRLTILRYALVDLAHRRIEGSRVKHRVKENWIKMYDKAGMVLRVETVINNPEYFRVRRTVRRERDGRWSCLAVHVGLRERHRMDSFPLV